LLYSKNGPDTWLVHQLLRLSIIMKSLVALEFCIQVMKAGRGKSFESACGDEVKALNWLRTCVRNVPSFAQDWTNPNAIKLARWLRDPPGVPYLEFCKSLQSEAELRASFDKEEGRWPPV